MRTEVVTAGPPELADEGGCLWWRDGSGIVGQGRYLDIEVPVGAERGAQAWRELRPALERRAAAGESTVAMGSLTFDAEEQGSILFIPQQVRRYEGNEAAPTPGEPIGPFDRLRYAGGEMDELRWLDEVAGAIRAVEHGTLAKVVLARDEVVWSRTGFSPRSIAIRLARAFPECYTFVCDGLVGATPELLVRKRGAAVESLVLAGSARRGSDPDDDAREAAALLASAKERYEHRLAVASVTDVLEEVSTELWVRPEPDILRLANVQHLATKVTAQLADEELSVLELVDRLHPTAAVGGVPRDAALTRIREAENGLRGRYAGPVGWVDHRGDGEWGIALRCALITGKKAQLFAGAGVVAGSLPEAELEETRLKLRAMESVLGDTV